MAKPGWTVTVEVDADLDFEPNDAVHAAMAGWDHILGLLDPVVTVHHHLPDGTVETFTVDLETEEVTS